MEIPRRHRIVIALDGSEYAAVVLEHALDQAARYDRADLHAIHVVDDLNDCDTAKLWLAETVLDGFEVFRARQRDWRTRLHIRAGRTDEEIVGLAADIEADLIVVGRYGLHRRKTTNRVLDGATCPTLVVGLTEHVIDPHPYCPPCVLVREESEGDQWFCPEHLARAHASLSTRLLPDSPSLVSW